MCGENKLIYPKFQLALGSPPRVRGKRVHKRRNPSKNGITPACAGKTCKHTRLILLPQDHPRVCGENACVPREYRACVGSPPRVRGKLNELRKYVAAMRITPACAGKTGCLLRAWPCCQDHPRVCGENYQHLQEAGCRVGSPPRVRGKPSSVPLPRYLSRITPACAGKT